MCEFGQLLIQTLEASFQVGMPVVLTFQTRGNPLGSGNADERFAHLCLTIDNGTVLPQ